MKKTASSYNNAPNAKATGVAFVCVSIALVLFIIVIYRAATICFTHDESLSYTILKGNPLSRDTANNHWLNTALSFLAAHLFGYGAFSLRLANVLSFPVYAFYGYKLLSGNLKSGMAVLIGFVLITCNQFLLDFFSLFRGYGIGMACFAASLYYVMQATKDAGIKQLLRLLIATTLTIYANYSFLIPVFALEAVLIVWQSTNLFSNKKVALRLVLFLVVQVVLLLPAFTNILLLKRTNQLYFGGDTGFIADTFVSILQYTFTPALFQHLAIAKLLFLVCFLGGLLFIMQQPALRSITGIMLIAALVPVLLHRSMGMKYATDRAALYWTLLLGIYIASLLDAFLLNRKQVYKYPAVASAVLIIAGTLYSYFSLANVTYTTIWKFDALTYTMLQDLNRTKAPGESYTLGIDWLFEPTINYYREVEGYNRLQPVTREDAAGKPYDYYYIFADDVPSIPVRTIQVKAYPLVNTVLLKKI